MSNNITIEFCAEDRARIDRLTAALESRIAATEEHQDTEQDAVQVRLAETLLKADRSKKVNTEAVELNTPEEEITAAETAKPTVTLEQIQQKVMQLATGNGGAKKAKVRETINAYGAKVSDLKEQPDKWTEVWDKLIALESEG